MPEYAQPANSGLDDDELVTAYLDSADDTYFDALYERYASKVYARCMSFSRGSSDAEDLVQEVFVKVFLHLHRFRQEASFSTWLFRLTTNHCLNFLRDRKVFVELENPESPSGVTDSGVRAADDGIRVRTMLEQLPLGTRALLLLKYRDGYSYDEIAEKTGLTPSAVKMRISRARSSLKKEK